MTISTTLDHLSRARLATGIRALAVGLALVVIGYGIARPPESLVSTNEARASEKPRVLATVALPEADGMRALPASAPLRAADSNELGGSSSAPRECEPEQGHTDACIFN